MAKQLFVSKRFNRSSLEIIERANAILDEYAAQNLVLTLRQLYYQFVARGMLPNKQTEYKRLGAIISDARLAGLVDWNLMEDRTRNLRKLSEWDTPSDIVAACAAQFRLDRWENQTYRPEVWIEKEALVGVIENVCNEFRVPYFACRGYSSQSAQYEAGRRFQLYKRQSQIPIVFHLGDHDPSGIDMTRDNAERLSLFARHGIEVRRLALTMAQIEQYNPPPNPAKESDSRATGYIEQYGRQSWELDALEPSVIGALIRENVEDLIARREWQRSEREEEKARDQLRAVADEWERVSDFLEGLR